jgi:hypothetical protein
MIRTSLLFVTLIQASTLTSLSFHNYSTRYKLNNTISDASAPLIKKHRASMTVLCLYRQYQDNPHAYTHYKYVLLVKWLIYKLRIHNRRRESKEIMQVDIPVIHI